MDEELLYLGLLLKLDTRTRLNMQNELCRARDIVAAKYHSIRLQEVQESFEELSVLIKNDMTIPDTNKFKKVAIWYRGSGKVEI